MNNEGSVEGFHLFDENTVAEHKLEMSDGG